MSLAQPQEIHLQESQPQMMAQPTPQNEAVFEQPVRELFPLLPRCSSANLIPRSQTPNQSMTAEPQKLHLRGGDCIEDL